MSIPGAASPLFIGAAAAAEAGYQIDRSLRFNSADSAYLGKTFGSAGSTTTWTLSFWIKRSNTSGNQSIFMSYNGSSIAEGDYANIEFNSSGEFVVGYAYAAYKHTNRLFRDFSSWYHIVVRLDTGNSTASDRVQIYVNGVKETSFKNTHDPDSGQSLAWNKAHIHRLGSEYNQRYMNGYLAEVHFVDGTALDADSFGEFDSNNVWQPKEYSGTYGTNGFYLKFADNSSNAALGTDSSGNSNTWTVNNLVAAVNEISASSSEISNPNNSVANHLNIFDGDTSTTVSSGNGGRVIWTPSSNISISKIEGYFDDSLNGYRITMSVSGGSSQTITVDTSSGGTANQWNEFTSLSGDTIGPSNAITFSMLRPAGNDTDPGLHDLNALRINDKLVVLNSSQAGVDSLIDTPTNYTADSGNNGGNHATFNPLDSHSQWALSQGNLQITKSGSGGDRGCFLTLGPTSGKFYWEVTFTTLASENYIGLAKKGRVGTTTDIYSGGTDAYMYRNNGNKHGQGNGSGGASYGASWAANDVIGVAVDWDAGSITFYKNGSTQGTAWTGQDFSEYMPAVYANTNQSPVAVLNTGARPFSYTAPTGYVSLCTANLPDPTIADGSTVFDVITATGTAADRTFTMPGGFGPDFVWAKQRNGSSNHALFDTVRGATKRLVSNSTQAEDTQATQLKAFTSTGFTYGSDIPNNSSQTGVYWAWDAGTTTASNTDGSITSSVRANQSAGFSIVSWTGNGTSGSTVGHGLNAAPKMVIFKNRDTANTDWRVYNTMADGSLDWLYLNTTAAKSDSSLSLPTSTVFTAGGSDETNGNGDAMITYCFTPVEGFSSFGSYQGNGSDDGPFVFTGFRVAWLMIKNTSTSGETWTIYDSTRDVDNTAKQRLLPNSSDAESVGSSARFKDLLSNGFKIRGTSGEQNTSGDNYIYAAFAEHPFKTARAR